MRARLFCRILRHLHKDTWMDTHTNTKVTHYIHTHTSLNDYGDDDDDDDYDKRTKRLATFSLSRNTFTVAVHFECIVIDRLEAAAIDHDDERWAKSIGCCFGQLLHTHKQRRHKVTSVRVRVRLCVCAKLAEISLFFSSRPKWHIFHRWMWFFSVVVFLCFIFHLRAHECWAELSLCRAQVGSWTHREKETSIVSLAPNKQTNKQSIDWLTRLLSLLFHVSMEMSAIACVRLLDLTAHKTRQRPRRRRRLWSRNELFWSKTKAQSRRKLNWICRTHSIRLQLTCESTRDTDGYSLISTKRVLLVVAALDRSKTKTKAHFHWLIIVNREQLAHAVFVALRIERKKVGFLLFFHFKPKRTRPIGKKRRKVVVVVVVAVKW